MLLWHIDRFLLIIYGIAQSSLPDIGFVLRCVVAIKSMLWLGTTNILIEVPDGHLSSVTSFEFSIYTNFEPAPILFVTLDLHLLSFLYEKDPVFSDNA